MQSMHLTDPYQNTTALSVSHLHMYLRMTFHAWKIDNFPYICSNSHA